MQLVKEGSEGRTQVLNGSRDLVRTGTRRSLYCGVLCLRLLFVFGEPIRLKAQGSDCNRAQKTLDLLQPFVWTCADTNAFR